MARHRYLLAAASMVTGAVMVLTSGPAQAAPPGTAPGADPVAQLEALQRSFAGHSGFAGGYIDDAGQPAVNVTSAALAERVRQAGGVARQVAVPLAALRRAADRIEAQAGDSVQIAIPTSRRTGSTCRRPRPAWTHGRAPWWPRCAGPVSR